VYFKVCKNLIVNTLLNLKKIIQDPDPESDADPDPDSKLCEKSDPDPE
jgi:hypothetical protein